MNDSKSNCYDYPRYYEIAFSFRDIPYEVGVIEQTIDRYALCDVRSLLELACGPSQHMTELSRRGLYFQGMDINQAMLDYSREKAIKARSDASFHRQSMVKFQLEQPVEYVFIALGDLYVRSTEELKSHLSSVATTLRQGGLFLLDWCVQFDPVKMFKADGDTWEIKDGSICVKSCVKMRPTNYVEQLFEEQLDIEVEDASTFLSLSSYSIKRAVYPQEFLELIKNTNQFEFIGWWNNWDLDQPLTEKTQDVYRPITLLRRI